MCLCPQRSHGLDSQKGPSGDDGPSLPRGKTGVVGSRCCPEFGRQLGQFRSIGKGEPSSLPAVHHVLIPTLLEKWQRQEASMKPHNIGVRWL